MWELLARTSMDYAAEVWWTGGHSACRKLESSQIKIGRRLLRASNIVAGVAVQGDLGWRKLEQRREEMKVMFGKRLEVLEEARLVLKVVNKLREDGGFGWWEEYVVLRRKYELGSEYRLVHSWKEKIKVRNEKDWEEEVSSKSTLKWYKLAKNGAGVVSY